MTTDITLTPAADEEERLFCFRHPERETWIPLRALRQAHLREVRADGPGRHALQGLRPTA